MRLSSPPDCQLETVSSVYLICCAYETLSVVFQILYSLILWSRHFNLQFFCTLLNKQVSEDYCTVEKCLLVRCRSWTCVLTPSGILHLLADIPVGRFMWLGFQASNFHILKNVFLFIERQVGFPLAWGSCRQSTFLLLSTTVLTWPFTSLLCQNCSFRLDDELPSWYYIIFRTPKMNKYTSFTFGASYLRS